MLKMDGYKKEIIMKKQFTKPKFKIGEEVILLENYTKNKSTETYIVVEIKLSCVTVLSNPNKNTPFTYSILNKKYLGVPHAFTLGFDNDINEDFLLKVKG